MTAQQEESETTKKQPIAAWDKWFKALVFGLVVMGLYMGYLVATGTSFSLRVVNLGAAGASVILISLSLALSGLTYFWDFLDRFLVYRRYVGVMGFFLSLVHVVITLVRMGSFDKVISYVLEAQPQFMWGLMALLLLLLLTVVSNNASAKILGNVWWRRILRLGYVALLFTLFHFWIMKSKGWSSWFDGFESAPPTSLLLAVIIGLVFLLRIVLGVALMIKARSKQSSEEIAA